MTLDAFVWDDGWDDFNSLWAFHDGFPERVSGSSGAGALRRRPGRLDVALGRLRRGQAEAPRLRQGPGIRNQRRGFSMAGPKYAAFRDVCLKMMRDHGVVFFKFDGMGAGPGTGAKPSRPTMWTPSQPDRDLRGRIPRSSSVPRSARGPVRSGHSMPIRSGVRAATPVFMAGRYPPTVDHLSRHVLLSKRRTIGAALSAQLADAARPFIGERTNPAKMTRDEKSVADEVWSFFGSGTACRNSTSARIY